MRRTTLLFISLFANVRVSRSDFCKASCGEVIYFVHSSGTESSPNGVARCAIESAAVQNPSAKIVVVSESWQDLGGLENEDSLENVELAQLELKAIMSVHDGLSEWYTQGRWKSGFKHHHLADAARLAILWECGGAYLDLDLVSVSSLERYSARAMIGLEDESRVVMCNAAMVFRDRRDAFVKALLDEFVSSFDANTFFGWNGPQLLGRTWENAGEAVRGHVQRVGPEVFYPIPWNHAWKFFSAKVNADQVLSHATLGVHLWQSQIKGQLELVGLDYRKENSFVGELFSRSCARTYDSLVRKAAQDETREATHLDSPFTVEITHPVSGAQLYNVRGGIPIKLNVAVAESRGGYTADDLQHAVVCFRLNGKPVEGGCVSLQTASILLGFPGVGHHVLEAQLCSGQTSPRAGGHDTCYSQGAGTLLANRAVTSFSVEFHSIQVE